MEELVKFSAQSGS